MRYDEVRLGWRVNGSDIEHVLLARPSGMVDKWVVLGVHPAAPAYAETLDSLEQYARVYVLPTMAVEAEVKHINEQIEGMRDTAKRLVNALQELTN